MCCCVVQLCRAVVQCVVCGVSTRWFHGDCPFMGDEEEASHEHQGQERPNATLPTTVRGVGSEKWRDES